MPAETFQVVVSRFAEADLYEIEAYWIEQGEARRGEKYFRDLADAAEHELTDPAQARRGRALRSDVHPSAREILVFGCYRIIYQIDETLHRVEILRFWHAHRREPGGPP